MNRNNQNKRRKNKKKNNNGGYNLPSNGYSTRQRTALTFLDPHMYITLKYTEAFTSSVLTAAGSSQTMRLNSIFDPNSAVGGTQPYGYDQMSTLYNRYRVLKARWKVSFLASSGTYNAVVIPINGTLNAAIADIATFTAASMVPFASYKNYNLGAIAPTFTGSMPLNKLGGVSKVEYLTDDRFEAQIGANPAEVISLLIGFQNPTGGTISIGFVVEIWYEVDLHDPISQAAS